MMQCVFCNISGLLLPSRVKKEGYEAQVTKSIPLIMFAETEYPGPPEKRTVTTKVVSISASLLICHPILAAERGKFMDMARVRSLWSPIHATRPLLPMGHFYPHKMCTTEGNKAWSGTDAVRMKLCIWTTNVSIQMMLLDGLGFTEKQHEGRLKALPLTFGSQMDTIEKIVQNGAKIMMKGGRAQCIGWKLWIRFHSWYRWRTWRWNVHTMPRRAHSMDIAARYLCTECDP